MSHLRTHLVLAAFAVAAPAAFAQTGGPYSLTWSTIDSGGGRSTGGAYTVTGTIGQHDAGSPSGGNYRLGGGFWAGIGSGSACYANCDGSTIQPVLNVDDFTCFINRFAQNDPYANCDGSTIPPVLNVDDFTCFINSYAQGCN